MPYRDEREALRAQVDKLQQELELAKEAAGDPALFAAKPRRPLARAALAGATLLVVAAAGLGSWQWSQRAADREIGTAWGHLSTCLIGDPLAASETVSARVRRIQLAYASAPRETVERWPSRCRAPAHALYQRLRENGREERDAKDAAYWAEQLATKIEHGVYDDEVLELLEPLWKEVQAGHIVAVAAPGDTRPMPPASPLHLGDLESATITTVQTAGGSLYTEMFPGPDRHVLIDAPESDQAVLCTLTAQAEAVACRPLPGPLGHKHGLRLLGTTDAGAAPLVFAGHEGAEGIFRSDTGEVVASVRAYGGYAAADGYVAVQSWPSEIDGSFEVFEQRGPHAEVTKTSVKPEAQKETQAVSAIHRSRILWDKALLQLIDQKDVETSPWLAYRTLPREGAAGAFHRIGDLNWINTSITGCRGSKGIVARFGPNDGSQSFNGFLLFNDGDHWQGPMAARGVGEMRCDGADAVFLSPWPVLVKRCTPAGCDEQAPHVSDWPTPPTREMSVIDVFDGKIAAAWATDARGVRFRIGPAAQLGSAPEGVAFDDFVGAGGEPTRTSVLSGMRLVAAGHTAVLFLATSGGIRAIRLGVDGSFAPATIVR